MKELFGVISAVLWSFIGLGGCRANAEQRTRNVGLIPIVAVALVLALLLVLGLVALVHIVVSP